MIQPETTKYERDMRRMYVFILLILGLLALSGYVAIIY
ncbi:MAG: hypothetical protein SCAL_000668 [Candidatus Syntrophoarchaeum caldarius]|uniref:Uncharacterized protein n=1 Tax=Candidatus Syntropharchaeum caldarium TaxID=1838285 RepID=A0A1F2P9T1_9EURY|nr:MAG: hypothetical protein SCAL_000668 [Candidatus Syntrophoarchaeum caldarius]